MTTFRAQRLRDPIHGLIVFRDDVPVDELAWSLICTPEFQRLRRIKQLGVSEFVYPGATHTRFAHCVGVFHTARKLVEIVEREIGAIDEVFKKRRSEVALVAALLHDLGHGPFSHTFEGVRIPGRAKKKHEIWTAAIIRNQDGNIRPLLERYRRGGAFCKDVAALLESEDPKDIYHSIVSSSFDADRLDYLRRDRHMTGTGAGAIDFDWLMEHLRVRNVSLEAADVDFEHQGDDGEGPVAPTFCLDLKVLPAAEQFLLSRYTLHEQVYFHKTTRCIERMIALLLRRVAELAGKNRTKAPKLTGLSKDHPLLLFLSKDGATLTNYLALDDIVVMGGFERMASAEDSNVRELAQRLRDRRLYKTLDTRSLGLDPGTQVSKARKIEKKFKSAMEVTVFKDEGAELSIYSQVGGDEEKAHKKLRILDAVGQIHEISKLSPIIERLSIKRQLTRYYFADVDDRDAARNI